MKILFFFLLTTSVFCQEVYLRDIIIVNEQNLWAVGDNGLVLKTTDGGNNWLDVSIQTADDIMEIESFSDKLWIRTHLTDRILYSEDIGQNWSQIQQFNNDYISNMIFLSDSLGFLTASEWKIFKTMDGGASWTQINGSYYTAGPIFFINESTGWVGGYNGIYATTDGGNEWITKGMNVYSLYTQELFFLDQNTGYVVGYGESNNGIWYGLFASTTNNGSSWSYYTQSDFISDVHFSSPDTGWIVSNNIILHTNDHGISWQSTNANVNKFEFTSNKSWGLSGQDKILFSNDGWNSWTQQYPKPSSVEDEMLNQYSLSQNYPNPFNPSTTIKYSIKEGGIVTIGVYDILGRMVKRLVNKFQSVGEYTITFGGEDLPSGVYLYRMSIDNFSETKKLLLLK